MIDGDTLLAAVQDSQMTGNTARIIKHLTLRVVDSALRRVYGDNFSELCLQSSVAIKEILRSFAIDSDLVHGAACLVRASTGMPFSLDWAGFWDQDHHVWVHTANYEIVDFTISHLHRHPRTTTQDEAIPPIWWSPSNQMPPAFVYLIEGVVTPQLQGEDQTKLDELISVLPDELGRVMDSCTEIELRADPIITDIEQFNRLASSRHPWASKASQIQSQNITMPPWILERFQTIGGRLNM